MQWLAVAIGGALGAMGRYAITIYTFPLLANRFPLGTLTANVLGSLLIGICYVLIIEKGSLAPEWRNWLMAGFLGALTTFSTFALDAVNLWQNGHAQTAAFYVVVSLVACLLAVAAGIHLTLRFY
ncbi:fluoride efflux transporter CrcB [Pseudomaricurvus alkylphenolicus]|jgi:CrcB protein|uniref:fluoride efflux transporter CrcB n=1 Tax=Pseudomaricurvus alkylphenolicus TaxID=1306991 RepID=UPI001420E954|nr:fluoride efflux transporter CrcB [Pseudomaricurvus alkylphenolicus]NIB41166.1 fluoride efflux transporter CrcB [Pseudomaricurvus alkylphenolicus]